MELDPLKIVKENLVRTGFMDKYNELVDVVIYKVESDGSNLIFYTNVDTTIIPMTSNISDLLDVKLDGLTSGQILLYDGTNWVNTDFNPSDLDYVRPDYSTRSVLSDVGEVTSITDALDKILYPYEYPSFTSFGINGKSNTLELGQDLIQSGGETPTFSWGVNYLYNISLTDGYTITDITDNIVSSSDILPNTTTSSPVNIPYQIVNYNPGDIHTFEIKTKNTQDDFFSRNKTYNWLPRRFWGTNPNGGALDSSEIISLTNSNTGGSELSNTYTQSRLMDGNEEYIHFYWEESLGDTNGFLVGNLPNSAWTRHVVSFTNQYGYTTNYIGYVTFNPAFGTGIKIDVT